MAVATHAPATSWRCGSRVLTLDGPRLIGVLNVTPDSFSDGGRFTTVESAMTHGLGMLDAGASMLDVGGESSRPGAERVSDREQIRRVAAPIEALRARCVVPISVDTTRSVVAAAALDAGADVVNDVSAGTDDPALLPLVAERGAGLVLMHRLRPPRHDRYSDAYERPPRYDDVVIEVRDFLLGRVAAAERAGVDPAAIAIDPGLGFGKTVKQNLALMARIDELVATGRPVWGASSRKSFLGAVSGVAAPAERVSESVAASILQWEGGVRLFRVHDVAEHREALAAVAAMAEELDGSPRRARITATPPGRPFMSDNVLEFTDATFESDVIQADLPVLVDFWAEWCQPCQMLTPTIEELATDYADRVKVGKVDTDANREVPVKYGISAIPTIILFQGGEVKKKFVGLTSKDQFREAIDELVA